MNLNFVREKILPQANLYKKLSRGFALIEVLIAVTIVSSAMIVVVGSANKYLLFTRSTLRNYQSALAMEESVEAIKIIRAASWANISSLTTGSTYGINFTGSNWQTVPTPQTTSLGFTRSIVFYDVYRDASDDIAISGTLDPGTKRVVVTITWNNRNTPRSQTIEFYIADIL